MHAAPPHALADLTASVADEPRWGAALHRYAASFGDGLLGGAVMAGGVSQLARWESEFGARPDVDYWLRAPAPQGACALVVMGIPAEAAQGYDRHYRLQDPLWDAMARNERTAGTAPWVATDAPPARAEQHNSPHADLWGLLPSAWHRRAHGGRRAGWIVYVALPGGWPW